MTAEMSRKDRDSLIRIVKQRARQAEREIDAEMAHAKTEVLNLMTAEFDAQDKLWKEAVTVAQQAADDANNHIREQIAAIGVPPECAPQISVGWISRSTEFSNAKRRVELERLADARIAALTKDAKSRTREAALHIEEKLILGGFESDAAKEILASMPSPKQLIPTISLEDLGMQRWQLPTDVARQLAAPTSTQDLVRRQALRHADSSGAAAINGDEAKPS